MFAKIILPIILILILLSPILLIKPNRRRIATKFFTKYKYAHRGLFSYEDGIPENSLAAFEKAKNYGFGVELDVQLTSDKKAVVFHDEDLNRMCGVDKKVWMLTYNELCNYSFINSEEKIPLFSDVLAILADTPIICEIKIYSSNSDLTVCKIVSDIISQHPCKLCIESFNPLAVRYFRKNNPDIVRGQLSMNFSKVKTNVNFSNGFILKNLFLNFLTKPDFLAYLHHDRKCFSFLLCKKIYKPITFAWTITTQAEEDSALVDFDTVIFEGYIPKITMNTGE